MSAARYMLDEEHERLPKDTHDTNSYILGQLSGHNVVIASLPEGSQGTVSAATVAIHLARTFPSIVLRLLVGIGGGVPSENDVRLGDVVVSAPVGTSGGVIEYDLGKQTPRGFERKGSLCSPPTEWRSVMTSMKSDHRTRPNRIGEFLSEMLRQYPQLMAYQRPPPEKDVLFQLDYEHDQKETTCANCDKSRAVNRRQRASPDEPVVFYGLIASGNRVMKDATERDNISKDSGGALCYEMEAAGLMNDFRCIVIRGISDYSDSHKNDDWHAYAAAVAGGLAKEILSYMDPTKGTLMSLMQQVCLFCLWKMIVRSILSVTKSFVWLVNMSFYVQ
jgi:nucleoside phosphorylase